MITMYFFDRNFLMYNRIKSHNWKYYDGYYIGDFIYKEDVIIDDTIKKINGGKAIIRCCYLNKLYIRSMDYKNKGVYTLN